MKKSNKKQKTNKKIEDKIENKSRKEKNDWEKPERERMVINQEKKSKEFHEFDHHKARMHHHHEETLALPHMHTCYRPIHRRHGYYRCYGEQQAPLNMRGFNSRKHRPYGFRHVHDEIITPRYSDACWRRKGRTYDRKMGDYGPMRGHHGYGIRQFHNERVERGREMGFHSHGANHPGRGLPIQTRYPRHHGHAVEQTKHLLYGKQRLERRLAMVRHRLHSVNRQLQFQIG